MFNAKSMPSRKTMRGNPVLALRGGFALLVMILLQIMIVSCKSGNDNLPVDRSFLTQQPCASPCWYGIEPEKSSTSDVYATLSTLPFVDQNRIAEGRTTWLKDDNAKQIGFDCVNHKGDSCGGLFTFSQGTLKDLLLTIPYHLTFQMAADRLGPPDFVNARPMGPEQGGCIIILIWSLKGIYIRSVDPGSTNYCGEIWKGGLVPANLTAREIGYITRNVLQTGPNFFFGGSLPFPGFSKP